MKSLAMTFIFLLNTGTVFAQDSCYSVIYNATVSKQYSTYHNNDSEASEVAELACTRQISLSDYTATRSSNVYGMGFNSHEQAIEVAKLISQNQIALKDYMAVRKRYLSTGTLDHREAIQNAMKSLKYK